YRDAPLTVFPWQSLMLSAMDQNRVYVASTMGKGIAFTENEGKDWIEDSEWDEGLIGGDINSFAQLKNNVVYAYSNTTDSLYRKDNKTDKWSYVNQSNMPIPSALDLYHLSHFDNALLLV